MKFSTVTATMALGIAVSAVPTAAPAKFAIQVSAMTGNAKANEPQVLKTVYLSKAGKGVGTTDIKMAESCSIDDKAHLVCGGKIMGANPNKIMGMVMAPDMAALEVVDTAGKGAMFDGFRIVGDELHWKSTAFDKLPTAAAIKAQPGGEAAWGLLESKSLTGGQMKIYSQLGCPGGAMTPAGGASHGGLHDILYVGKSKIVPL